MDRVARLGILFLALALSLGCGGDDDPNEGGGDVSGGDAAGSDTASPDGAGPDVGGPGGADSGGGDPGGGGPGGLGCTCSGDPDCAEGFCSDVMVCTTTLAFECDSDADCDCGARCFAFDGGASRSCQAVCATTADCPGTLVCEPLLTPWVTTTGESATLGCIAPPPGGGGPTVTWTGDIQPIVQARCSGCHTGGGQSGGVRFDTWGDTQPVISSCPPGVNRPVYEIMALKVAPNPPCGNQMPPSGPLSPAEIQLFADWAAGGGAE